MTFVANWNKSSSRESSSASFSLKHSGLYFYVAVAENTSNLLYTYIFNMVIWLCE